MPEITDFRIIADLSLAVSKLSNKIDAYAQKITSECECKPSCLLSQAQLDLKMLKRDNCSHLKNAISNLGAAIAQYNQMKPTRASIQSAEASLLDIARIPASTQGITSRFNSCYQELSRLLDQFKKLPKRDIEEVKIANASAPDASRSKVSSIFGKFNLSTSGRRLLPEPDFNRSILGPPPVPSSTEVPTHITVVHNPIASTDAARLARVDAASGMRLQSDMDITI